MSDAKKCQCFIASYPKDREWLHYCLLSLKKFSTGFLPPVVGVTAADYDMFRAIADATYPETTVVAYGDPGWMPAQVRMQRADQFCPDADFIFLLGSDCLAVSEFRASDFFRDGKPVMLYSTFSALLKTSPAVAAWKKGTERVLGFKVPNESMRRVPTIHPRGLYAPMRAHVESVHGMPFDKYIPIGETRGGGTSETNILGGFAWEKMRDIYHWVCIDDAETKKREHIDWPCPILQFWSHGSLDRKCERDMSHFGVTTLGKPCRQIITEVLASPDPVRVPSPELPVPMLSPVIVEPEAATPVTSGKPRLVCALGICHRDVGMAEMWLRWASYLASLPNGSQAGSVLVVSGTQRLSPKDWSDLREAVIKSDGMFEVVGNILPDEMERGYPQSASHLFIRTMQFCTENHPGSPILWVEPDSVPMRPGWFTEIEKEYEACGKPFMGYLEGVTTVKHMTGIAVYPTDWATRAPRLVSVLDAPDDPRMGERWKGAAFDMYAASETVPQMAVAKTIQQIWRPPSFTAASLKTIKPATALFHQCKDGKLIATLAAMYYPDFVQHIPKPAGLFALRGHHHKGIIGHEQFPITLRTMRLSGGWWSIITPRSKAESIKLAALCVPGQLEEVTQEQLENEARKVQKKRSVQHV